jgi:hypothetical protein
MKAITIHGLDEPLVSLLEARAKAEGLSLNKTVKILLEKALGIKPREPHGHRRDFEMFRGRWTSSDLSEFEKATAELERVDPEDWK